MAATHLPPAQQQADQSEVIAAFGTQHMEEIQAVDWVGDGISSAQVTELSTALGKLRQSDNATKYDEAIAAQLAGMEQALQQTNAQQN